MQKGELEVVDEEELVTGDRINMEEEKAKKGLMEFYSSLMEDF
jgi:hypothetical protein